MQAQEKQAEVNTIILQSLSKLQRQGPLQINHGQENRTNGEYGGRSHGGHTSDRDDTVKDGRFLDTLDWRGDGHMYYFSFGFDMLYDLHCYHPYRRSDMGYLSNEFKKSNPPTFDRYLKKSADVEAWLLGMKKFFQFHNYIDNMKARVDIFSLKGKEDIWWEDVKQIGDIKTEELNFHEFKKLFRKKYLSGRYYDNKAKEFYELKMGSMIDS